MYRLEQPVVGYRLWYTQKGIHAHEGNHIEPGLFSLSVPFKWAVGMNVASCKPIPFSAVFTEAFKCFEHTDICPDPQCMCGLHGGARPKDVERWVYSNHLSSHVIGAILMGGQMFSGGQVIRAEKAQVICLLGSNIHPSADARAEEYKVPLCESIEHLRYVATDYGNELTTQQIKELENA